MVGPFECGGVVSRDVIHLHSFHLVLSSFMIITNMSEVNCAVYVYNGMGCMTVLVNVSEDFKIVMQ